MTSKAACVALFLAAIAAVRAGGEPALRIGVFLAGPKVDGEKAARIAQGLKGNHFNTVVSNGAFDEAVLAVFREQGLDVVVRDAAAADHDGVIAVLTGEAVDPRDGGAPDFDRLGRTLAAMQEQAGKPVIACLNGEGMGLFRPGEPQRFWEQTVPAIRCFRWYGIRRGHYGLVHRRLYNGYLSYSSVLRIAQTAAKTPYWVVLPAFGRDKPDAEFANPSPAQIRSMMHLAAAYGARGILLYAYQDHDDWNCLVDGESLDATDGKLAAAAEVAGLLTRHGKLLASLGHGGGDIRCPNIYIESLGKPRKEAGEFYLYSISKNPSEPVTTRLQFWHEHGAVKRVHDVYTGETLEILAQDEEGFIPVPITFEPGQGRLLAIEREPRKKK